MTNDLRVLVHPDVPTLVGAVGARALTKMVDLLDDFPEINVVLTGGVVGGQVLEAIGGSRMRSGIDWTRVHFWWGDERFLPKGDPQRNETLAREQLFSGIPVPESNIHPFPASDEVADLETAAEEYARVLADHAEEDAPLPLPRFDILFLGVGPDGHVASLFPDRECNRSSKLVIAVHDAPKPPPERLSLTLSAINSAQRAWMVLAGADKASALGLALAGASEDDVPAAGVRGRKRTVVFIDDAAASQVPTNLIASSY